jgi:hypothetical protein
MPIEYEAGWILEPVWSFWRREKSVVPGRIQTLDCPAHSLVTILIMLSWLLSMSVRGGENHGLMLVTVP